MANPDLTDERATKTVAKRFRLCAATTCAFVRA